MATQIRRRDVDCEKYHPYKEDSPASLILSLRPLRRPRRPSVSSLIILTYSLQLCKSHLMIGQWAENGNPIIGGRECGRAVRSTVGIQPETLEYVVVVVQKRIESMLQSIVLYYEGWSVTVLSLQTCSWLVFSTTRFASGMYHLWIYPSKH